MIKYLEEVPYSLGSTEGVGFIKIDLGNVLVGGFEEAGAGDRPNLVSLRGA